MPRKSTRSNAAVSADPRAFVLAGIGAVSLGRKQATKSVDETLAAACALRKQAVARVGVLRKQATARTEMLRKQVESVLTPVALKAQSLATQAESQLRPLLGKLGIATPARKPARKSAPRKRVAKTGRRKAA